MPRAVQAASSGRPCQASSVDRIGRNGFAFYSLVSAIAGAAFLAFTFTDVTTRTYVGLFQRSAFGVMHVWLAAFALSLRPWAIESTDEPAGTVR